MAKQSCKDEQHINVYVRIRPFLENESKSSFLEVLSRKEVLSKSHYNQKRYIFDRVFDDQSTQQEIYSAVVSPLIPEVIGGYNCTVFAYGQTGTGKTYTMEGIHDRDNQINAGIIPRALAQIFKVLSNTNTESSVKVSYLELYNEELFDLLSQSNMPKAIKIFEDKAQKGSVILQGLEELSVTELTQVYKILEQGMERRRIASTIMNSSSSRSHTVFTIVVHTRETTIDGEELVKTGKLNLVDLAGSENISKSGAVDKRAREAGNINQSLLTLGRVIKALTEKNTHIPYRESKLTRILQDSLGGRTKTSLIATVSGTNYNMEETLNTLEYAMRARCIQNRPELNQKISRTALINQYSDTIERLQRDLVAMRTGTGVVLDEQNYTKLLSDNETQRAKLTEKLAYINKLETDISEKREKLHTLQASWVEAANNIEQLSNEKKILEHDLVLVKEVNEQHTKKLREVEDKNKHLEDETEKLLHDVQTHSLNEDTLHRKVSYLYQTSQTNRNIATAFYNMYNQLYLELVSRIDKCISFALNSIIKTDSLCKSNSKETYKIVSRAVDDLLQFTSDMREYKLKSFQNKQALGTRYDGYYNSLQTLSDSIHERSNEFINKFDDNLVYLRDTINKFLDEESCDIKIIIPTLVSIREAASNESAKMSNIFEQFHSTTISYIDDLIDDGEILRREVAECHELIVALQTRLNSNYDGLLRDISHMKHACTVEFSAYESRHRKIRSKYSNLTDKMHLFKETTDNSIISLRDEACARLDTLQESVHNTITTINEVNDNVQMKKENIITSLNERMNETSNVKTSIHNFLDENKTQLLNNQTDVHNIEAVDDEHYTTLNDITDSLSDQARNIQSAVHTLADQELEIKNNLEETMKETASELKDTLAFCSGRSQELKGLLDEFCGRKLQYPSHAGDTPQKVQPKSSLYVKTLARNCFSAINEGKKSQSVEEVEKENLSNNTLNVIYNANNESGE